MTKDDAHVLWFEDLGSGDVSKVGGKNASLGEMVGALKEHGVELPGGFATTSEAYWAFVDANGLRSRIQDALEDLKGGGKPLDKVGKTIRKAFLKSDFPREISDALKKAYAELCERYETNSVDVAVRSSATAEDLPEASFAGQQETFLNIS
jgi:pyruvate,water dikinase